MTESSDHRSELAIGRVLRVGGIASSICLGIGLVLSFGDTESRTASLLLAAGVVTLLATPGARLVVLAANYARERAWAFVLLTLIVIAELVSSMIAAWEG
jgi:uncharacterized membrane protein